MTFFEACFDSIVIIPSSFFQGDSSKYFLDNLERVGRPVSFFLPTDFFHYFYCARLAEIKDIQSRLMFCSKCKHADKLKTHFK